MNGKLNELAKSIHEWAVSNGFYEPSNLPPFDRSLINIHSEVSETLEEWRDGHDYTEIYYKDGKPEGIPIEFADIIIRVLDSCAYHGINIEEAIKIKMAYNRTRPYKNGGKRT